jgi:soluble lytic murein transglycosylase
LVHHVVLVAAALSAALPAAASSTSDTAAVRRATADVRSGLTHSTAGNATAAAAAYARATGQVPAFAPWAQLLSATAAARAGDTASVRRHLTGVDADLVRDWGWRARVEAALSARDSGAAARIAEAAAAAMPDTARRVQAWSRAGAIHLGARRNAEAAAAFRRAIDESVASSASVEAARLLSTLPDLAPADRLRIGRVFLRHRNLERATAAFDAYLASGRADAVERARIQLDIGRTLFDMRDYAAAERRLRLAVNAAGARETTAEATFMLGRSLYRQGRTPDARATFVRVTQEYAGTTAAAQAHFIIADIDHDANRIESAKTHYRAVVAANGPDAPLSAARLGSFALLENRLRDAAAIFRDAYRASSRAAAAGAAAGAAASATAGATAPRPAGLVASGPATGAAGRAAAAAAGAGTAGAATARQQPGYWWAHALEKAGARDSARLVFAEVRRLDPFSYYGLRAGERLGMSPWDITLSQDAAVPSAVRSNIVARLDVVDVLRAADLTEAAALEAARIVERFSRTEGALYALGDAYHARGQVFNGIRVGRDLLRREGAWNRHLLQLVYPFPYRDAIMREARASNVDPYLMAGLIRQESMFNTQARSPAGALGLMQVMPRTGTIVARSLGISGFQPARLTNPDINLRIGARYLADQIRSNNGRLVDAIAAYNAGPSRVAAWKRFPEYADPELFIERIPFQETRDYVKIVQQNARIYRELYSTPAR